MQVPEKLSLIGGSILLASTLIFTLKSQASNILPKVDSGMASLFKSDKDRQADQQKQDFDKDYQQAQQKHWQTGTWGTAQYYIDDGMNLHVGSGKLQGALEDTLGHDKLQQIQTINLDGSAQAPQNSYNLFGFNNFYEGDVGSNNTTSQINGLDKLDTSHVTNMDSMFNRNASLASLDLSHLNTSHVTNMSNMFAYDSALTNLNLNNFNTSSVTNMDCMFLADTTLANLNLNHFNTSNVTDMGYMFDYDSALSSLNLSNFNTSHVTNMYEMLDDDKGLTNLNLGSTTNLQRSAYYDLGNNYHQGNQTLSLDGQAHPGTWVKQ